MDGAFGEYARAQNEQESDEAELNEEELDEKEPDEQEPVVVVRQCSYGDCECGYDPDGLCDPTLDCSETGCGTCNSDDDCWPGDSCNLTTRACAACAEQNISAWVRYCTQTECFRCEGNPQSPSQFCFAEACL